MKIDGTEILVTDQNGKKIPCRILLTYRSDRTGKDYLIYTDDSTRPSGAKELYASIYNPYPDDPKLYPIESDAEWLEINAVCRKYMKLSD